VFHFLLDDLQFDFLLGVFQFVQPLLGGSVDNSGLDRVEHIGDAALGVLQLFSQSGKGAALTAL